MKTLLDNLDSSPLVGLILNQVRRKDYDAIQSSGYFEKVQSVLRESKANLKYFSAAGPLVIMDYDDNNYDDSNDDYDKGFNSAAITAIKSYVLSFEPTPVIVRRLFASTYMVVLTVLTQIVYAAVGM
ncbi:hypothetical protein BGX33_002297 [Mortierella sp. NVP41]|nr:hypothetical protein BGX33_002297 [Mortierella sp. NVP41]